MTAHVTGPASWLVGGATVAGASHVRRGIPNQDAISWHPVGGSGRAAILVVSDGHGSVPHFRSDIGSRLAVAEAQTVLMQALDRLGTSEPLPDPLPLGHAIIAGWRQRVLAHLAAHPVPAEQVVDNPFHPYGATLVAAAVTPVGALLIQLGDGDLLVRRRGGQPVRPLPEDPDLVGEQTYSLCLDDAEARLRVAVLSGDAADIDFLMLSTDGLGKSFAADDNFLQLATSWRAALHDLGLEAVLNGLPEWLSAASTRGSGDDVTLGFILRADAETPAGQIPACVEQTASTRTRWIDRPEALLLLALGLGGLAAAALFVLWSSYAPGPRAARGTVVEHPMPLRPADRQPAPAHHLAPT